MQMNSLPYLGFVNIPNVRGSSECRELESFVIIDPVTIAIRHWTSVIRTEL